MVKKMTPLLVIALLGIFCGGCKSTGPVAGNLDWPLFPEFTQDPTPEPPNYYWMTDSPFTHGVMPPSNLTQRGTVTRNLPPAATLVQPTLP